jgi:Protein of unknown function (DUF2804)
MPDHDSLVEDGVRRYGRLGARPGNVNPLDEFRGLGRALHRFRLKEWVGFTLIQPDWYSSLIMQDANYLASSEMYAYDRSAGTLYQHAANAPGGSLALPADLLESRCAFKRRGYELEYDFSRTRGRHSLHFTTAATSTAPAFQGELELDADGASLPLSVSSRLPGGRMYTHKAIFPAEGTVQIGDERIAFDRDRDLAILDEHKSFFPYQTRWLWGTFAMHAGQGLIGANFAARPAMPGEEEESCIWTREACEPLADVTFGHSAADPLAPWHISSRDGRLDVTFVPEGRKQVRHQLGAVAIDYFQLFGHYRGNLRGAAQNYPIEGVHGVCESMQARF